MPTISVLSWNAYGGNITDLATAITSCNIDIAVIQEAARQANAPFYAPLNALAPGYGVLPAIAENRTWHTPTGANIHPDPSLLRAYAVVYNTATIGAPGAPPGGAPVAALVDYTTQYACPNSAFQAGLDGFSQRPPLRVRFSHAGNTCVLYTWHAPLLHRNGQGIRMFDGCPRLAQDVASGNLVVIGGDMNNMNISAARFAAFDGLQDGYDHVFAANITGIQDTRLVPGTTLVQIGHLNALHAAPHWAVPATLTY
ncbi:hypothetical protein [Sorangium sp. So ce176]|uniref:hypothetical protein n=1 Tax=Sorangium sp. So ce176 TaxID=3133286 RepID=UPI003F5E3237